MKLRTTGGLLALAALLAPNAHGQALGLGTHFGPKAGVTLAVLDGQFNTKGYFKAGFNAGVIMRIRPSKGFAIQPELLYSQLGTDGSYSRNSSNPDFALRLNYLTVPLMFKAYLGSMFYLQAGPQLGFLLSAHRKGLTSAGGPDADVSSDYTGVDFSVGSGLGIDLPGGLVLSARASYGFTDINANDAEAKFRQQLGFGGLHNRSLEFSVGYLLKADKD